MNRPSLQKHQHNFSETYFTGCFIHSNSTPQFCWSYDLQFQLDVIKQYQFRINAWLWVSPCSTAVYHYIKTTTEDCSHMKLLCDSKVPTDANQSPL
ncbi:hypothetical protein KSS87_020550 [Heliosperma pusillum]|nr:hypothetical protein KSS87_020550 [Heliosperma pusillum]